MHKGAKQGPVSQPATDAGDLVDSFGRRIESVRALHGRINGV